MWRYNDSDLEASSAYCNYCGQTCANRRHLKNDLGVCNRCSRVLSHLTDSTNNNRTMSSQEASPPASTTEDMTETLSDGSESLSELSEVEELEEEEMEVEEEEAGDQDKSEVALCPRCWKNPPTTKLYDVPICQGCLQQANRQKELPAESRKRRFQPPTPALAPGKKLTRVCDTCRKRRKRCPHRRVVNADDPEADPRRKRTKATAQQSDDDEEGEKESEESEATLTSGLESSPTKSSELSEQSIEDAEEDDGKDEEGDDGDDGDDEVDSEDDEEEAEEPPRPIKRIGRANAKRPDNHDCEEVMKGAIRDSIKNVLGKEARDLISSVQEKLDQASQELTNVKTNIDRLTSQRGRKQN